MGYPFRQKWRCAVLQRHANLNLYTSLLLCIKVEMTHGNELESLKMSELNEDHVFWNYQFVIYLYLEGIPFYLFFNMNK